MKRYLHHPRGILSAEDLILLQRLMGVTAELFGSVRDAIKETESPLESFFQKLAWSSSESLRALLTEWYAIADSTRGCILADLRGVTEVFERGPMQMIFGPQRQRRITFEEAIQHGKILILNLPLGDSGDATWPVLVAAKLALFARLLGRAGHRQPLEKRGEAAALLRPRHGHRPHFAIRQPQRGTRQTSTVSNWQVSRCRQRRSTCHAPAAAPGAPGTPTASPPDTPPAPPPSARPRPSGLPAIPALPRRFPGASSPRITR